MEQLSRSEEQVMAALWACNRAATRRALADTGRLTYADTERLLRWLTEYQAANPEYDYE